MDKSFFVTGTDTGVGKTFVTCTLARLARSAGKRVFAFKPIETGCRWVGTQLVGEDQTALVEAAGDWQTGDLAGMYRYEFAASPFAAARHESVRHVEPISLDRILETFATGTRGAHLALMEGAGGWRVPITATLDMGGLAKRIGAPVIVVARATLGTINHTMLTVEAIWRDGLPVHAIVLSGRPGESVSFGRSNAEELRRLSGGATVLELWDRPEVLAPLS